MDRFCPKCKIKLGLYDYFFCSNCSEVLPDELVQLDESFRRVVTVPDEKSSVEVVEVSKKVVGKLANSISLSKILLGVVFLLGSVLSGYIAFGQLKDQLTFLDLFSKPEVVQESVQESPRVTNTASVTVDVEALSGELKYKEFANYVPYDIDVYIEGIDFEVFKSDFLILNPAYMEVIEYFEADASIENFAYIVKTKEDYFTISFLFFVDENLVLDETEIPQMENVHISRVENVLIISSDSEMYNLVYNARQKLTKSLFLNARFMSELSKMPSEGKALVCLLSDEGKQYIRLLETLELPDNFKKIVGAFSETDKNFVILK